MSDDQNAPGWCLPCYAEGAFTLSVDLNDGRCAFHGALSSPQLGDVDPDQSTGPIASSRRLRAPRGRAARTPADLPHRPPRRARTARRAAARRIARAMAYGRRRAAVRVASPGYTPHPGWRHFIAPGWRVLTDQAEALAAVDAVVDAQDWRTDKRAAWTAILRRLVYAMDWNTGLVAACTAERLGAAGARAPRTVSRVIAWARDVGLVVVVEHGASAEFLGTDHGRTPTYALVTNTPPPRAPTAPPDSHDTSPQLNVLVDELGDPTESLVENKPLNGGRLEPTTPATPSWPVFGVPQSAPERTAAARCLLERLGLDHGGVSRAPLWRTRALLKPWWDAGTCPAALLWAIDHHPDHPNHHRGDALRGAHDPLRVLGARLRPWGGRLAELPAAVTGLPVDYSRGDPGNDAAVPPRPEQAGMRGWDSPSTPSARAAAKAAVDAHLAQLRIGRHRDNQTSELPK